MEAEAERCQVIVSCCMSERTTLSNAAATATASRLSIWTSVSPMMTIDDICEEPIDAEWEPSDRRWEIADANER